MSSSLDDFAEAIDQNDFARVDLLITDGSVDANARLPRERNPPPLVFAAARSHAAIVELLLNAGSNVDGVDDDGHTACHVATSPDVLALLLARRPNLALRDARNRTPLEASFDLFFIPENQATSAMLIEAGAPLDVSNVNRSLLCFLAATNTVVTHALIKRDVVFRDLRDNHNRTPLHIAAEFARKSNVDIFELLVGTCGLDVHEHDLSGRASIHIAAAAIYGNIALRYLIGAGADVNGADRNGMTPLQRVGIGDSALLLLAAGADVHMRDVIRATVLRIRDDGMKAFLPYSLAHLHVLIAGGGDLDSIDASAVTPRQLLAETEFTIDASEVDRARRDISKMRLDFVRSRALQICIGLQSLRLDALQMCEVLLHACGPVAPLIAFHQWWRIATTVKHFRKEN